MGWLPERPLSLTAWRIRCGVTLAVVLALSVLLNSSVVPLGVSLPIFIVAVVVAGGLISRWTVQQQWQK